MGDSMSARGCHAERFYDRSRNSIEQINRPSECIQEPMERPRNEQRNPFRARQAHGLRDKFANNNMQSAQKNESAGEGKRMGQDRRSSSGHARPNTQKEICKSRLAQSAEREACQCDSQLHARNYAVQITQEVFHDFCAGIALCNELPNARNTHRHERKLRCGEEPVQRDECDDPNESDEEHSRSDFPVEIVTALASRLLFSPPTPKLHRQNPSTTLMLLLLASGSLLAAFASDFWLVSCCRHSHN